MERRCRATLAGRAQLLGPMSVRGRPADFNFWRKGNYVLFFANVCFWTAIVPSSMTEMTRRLMLMNFSPLGGGRLQHSARCGQAYQGRWGVREPGLFRNGSFEGGRCSGEGGEGDSSARMLPPITATPLAPAARQPGAVSASIPASAITKTGGASFIAECRRVAMAADLRAYAVIRHAGSLAPNDAKT